jgi:hypothetical protein
VNDFLIVEAPHVGGAPRTGEVLDVLGDPSHPHFAVRGDDGRESFFYPGDDVTLRHASTGG